MFFHQILLPTLYQTLHDFPEFQVLLIQNNIQNHFLYIS